jgi:STE24 endopeptidase
MQTESTDNLEAKKYQAMKNRLFLFNLIGEFVFLLVLVFTGWSHQLKIYLMHFRDDFYALNALYFICFSAMAFLISLPLDFYEGYLLEHRFGLSRQGFRSWAVDVIKKSLLLLGVSLILVEAVYYFLSVFAGTWWLWAAGFWFFVSILLTKIFPKVILPLFYKYAPLENGALREKIFGLFSKYGISLRDVYVLDFSKKTVKANAMVAGLGATKQIFLSDTLVQSFSPQEIEVVLAHEVGHYLHRDTFKIVLSGVCSALVSFYGASVAMGALIHRFGFLALSDIAGLPLLLTILLATGLVLLPLQNSYARLLEKRADRFALDATRNPAAFLTLMQRLGQKNFSDFSPSKIVEIFLYDHPPLSARIKMAQEMTELKGGHGL